MGLENASLCRTVYTVGCNAMLSGSDIFKTVYDARVHHQLYHFLTHTRRGSRNLRKGAGPSPSPPLLFPSPSTPLCLRSRSLKPARRSGGAVSYPSGVRGGAPAENEFGAL